MNNTTNTARPLAEIINDLSKPIAPEDLESKKKGGATLTFISWHRALKYLDRYAPGWSYEVRNIYHLAGRVALVVRISIPCAEGVVYREATGQEDEEKAGYGDPTSNAESMALRRAAAKFGLGLYLYDKDKRQSGNADRRPQQPSGSRQNAPRPETQGGRRAEAETSQGSKAGPAATSYTTMAHKDAITDFWKQVNVLKFPREDALAMVQDYQKGEHGDVGSQEAYQSLMGSLEAAARDSKRGHLRIA